MLRWLIPLSVIAAAAPVAAAPSSATLSLDNWWEKVTVRMTGDGSAQTCQYETNLPSGGAKDCKVVGGASAAAATGASSKEEYSTITFERRFSPGGAAPASSAMQTGDKLLGRDVMALAIDHTGKVTGCKMVLTYGETGLDYGCTEAAAEQFASAPGGADAHRQGFLTVLVYGHSEHVV
ncbi:MAG TPA: hypothetical protein VIZ66_01435 [Sphingomicrobium sp.]